MADSLQVKLECHMANDELIKGWEVARRICNGRDRGPLRKAAREVNAIRAKALAEAPSVATQSKYIDAIETLYEELAKAKEQDFDGMLNEALSLLKAQKSGSTAQHVPIPAALTKEQRSALERIRDYRFTNSPGHIGKAIDRDLRKATEIAKEVRAGLAAMAAASGAEELRAATAIYADAADRFAEELRRAGEPDFDGLLRQAVLVLDSAPMDDDTGMETDEARNRSGEKRRKGSGKGNQRRQDSYYNTASEWNKTKDWNGSWGYPSSGGPVGSGVPYSGKGLSLQWLAQTGDKSRRWTARKPAYQEEAWWGA